MGLVSSPVRLHSANLLACLVLGLLTACHPPASAVTYISSQTQSAATFAIVLQQQPAPAGHYHAQYLDELDWEQATATLTNTSPATNVSQTATATVAAGGVRSATLVFNPVTPATHYTLTLQLERTNTAGALVTVAAGTAVVTINPGPNSVNVPVSLDPTNGQLAITLPEPNLVSAFVINAFAGNGTSGHTGDSGPALSAELGTPLGNCTDGNGNVYVADHAYVRKIDATGTITTVAGNGTNGFSGDGGSATSAKINNATGVAVDGGGNLYIADTNNNRIRKVTPGGTISTLAGTGTAGALGDGAAATAAQLASPTGVVIDAAGNLYIADSVNNKIRKISALGVIGTYAGTGTAGDTGNGGPALNATLRTPYAVALDAHGNLYFADAGNDQVRKVDTLGTLTDVAGTGGGGYSGDGGPATLATLNFPASVAVDASGNVYFAEQGNMAVREVYANGTIATIAGTGGFGSTGDGGLATSALLATPIGVSLDAAGNLLVSDQGNHRVRRLGLAPVITSLTPTLGPVGSTVILTGTGFSATPGANLVYFNGIQASINSLGAGTINVGVPAGAASGNVMVSIAGQTSNSRAFTVATSPIINAFAGNGAGGYAGDGGPAASGQLDTPDGLALDALGNVYIADQNNNRIRKVALNGTLTTFAGTGASGDAGDGGQASAASVTGPSGIGFDALGNAYISEEFGSRIRKITPAGVISTYAGTGAVGYTGDGGPAVNAKIDSPEAIAVTPAGIVYFGDTGNAVIRKIDLAGVITTYAGTSGGGDSGDGGLAVNAQFQDTSGCGVDAAGNVYVCDYISHRVRKVALNGIITAFAGTGGSGNAGDGGLATAAQINNPESAYGDAAGNILIADYGNNNIRKVDPSGIITTLVGTGAQGASGNGGPAISAKLNSPEGTWLDAAGNVYVADGGNSEIRKVGTTPLASALTPATGPQGTVVLISGSGFSTTLASNAVTMNGILVPVTAATAAQLTLTVPRSVTTGPVKVTVSGQTSNALTFTVQ